MSQESRRDAQRRRNLLGGVLVGGALVALVVLIVLGQRTPLDVDAANCPTDGNYAAQISILVDPSDALTGVQRSVVPRLLQELEEKAPKTSVIYIYALAAAGRDDSREALRVCAPPHPDTVNPWWGNPRLARRTYEEFLARVRAALDAVVGAEEDDISPLLKGIQVAAVHAFQPRDSERWNRPRHLFIVSDMVQNSDAWSFYRDPVDFSWLLRKPDYATLRVNLRDVDVSVFLLARGGDTGRIQTGAMDQFWDDYFFDSGVDLDSGRRRVRIEG